jgi:hypothetical protein
MRSNWRIALAGACAVVLTVAGCDAGGAPTDMSVSGAASPSVTASVETSPTPPPVDPAATAEVCGLASAATDTTTEIFNEQIAALEQAAASSDQAAMVAAAEAINEQFADVAETFTDLATRPISPELQVVLTDIATALTEMSSLAYTGTTVDIRRKLLDFTSAIERTCTPPTTGASPTAG